MKIFVNPQCLGRPAPDLNSVVFFGKVDRFTGRFHTRWVDIPRIQ